jgi:hypothetical protein
LRRTTLGLDLRRTTLGLDLRRTTLALRRTTLGRTRRTTLGRTRRSTLGRTRRSTLIAAFWLIRFPRTLGRLGRLHHREDSAPIDGRLLRDNRNVAESSENHVELIGPHSRLGSFTTTHSNLESDFVALLQKLACVRQLRLQIVFACLWPQRDRFDLELRLRDSALRLIVAKLAVVHDFAHRRSRFGRNFDEVEAPLTRDRYRFLGVHNTQLFAGLRDDANRMGPDLSIHALPLFGEDGSSRSQN